MKIPFTHIHKYEIDKGNYNSSNLCRDGSLSSMSLQSPSMGWSTVNTQEYAFDGNYSTWYCRTGGVGNHYGLGTTLNFKEPRALKSINIRGHVGTFAESLFVVEYHDGTKWVTATAQKGKDAANGFYFNLDGKIKASTWRWYMHTYVYVYSNFYIYQVEAYEEIKYK